MIKKKKAIETEVQQAQSPLILRCYRLMDAFGKSDEERDFYLDRIEGFILYVDLNKSQAELDGLASELAANRDRYVALPKPTFYETKKMMEGFVNEKVYDIDTKEKLLDIIQSKDPKENFLEFLHDHLPEMEKWQQYYQERSRIRLIDWLRTQKLSFVFEEDLEMPKGDVDKLKEHLFDKEVKKDVAQLRDELQAKAKNYYSVEALNPRPKRGRPPKQSVKVEVEHQLSVDFYTTVALAARPFLYTPPITAFSSISFASKYDDEEETAALRPKELPKPPVKASIPKIDWSDDGDDDDEDEEEAPRPAKKTSAKKK